MKEFVQIPSQKSVIQFYDNVYETSGLKDPSRLYEWILKILNPTPRKKILDIACGEGNLLCCAEKAGLIPVGVDLSRSALKHIQKKSPRSSVWNSDGEELPFKKHSFDYVTSLGSLEHYRNMENGLDEMRRVLKQDGLACIMVPNKFWLGDVLEVMRFGECSSGFQIIERHGTKLEWKKLIESRGLKDEKIYRYNKPYPLWVASSWKIKSIRKFIWRRFFNFICPFNLSLEFVYLCRPQN